MSRAFPLEIAMMSKNAKFNGRVKFDVLRDRVKECDTRITGKFKDRTACGEKSSAFMIMARMLAMRRKSRPISGKHIHGLCELLAA
jgi:hypothetical protein